jgi:hypothetical protein
MDINSPPTAKFHQHRDESWTVTMSYPWREGNSKHRVEIMQSKKSKATPPAYRLWCNRCESQCSATIHLARHLAKERT